MAPSPPHGAPGDIRVPVPATLPAPPAPFAVSAAPALAPAASVAITGLGATARGGVPLRLPLPFLLTGALGCALFGVLLPWVAPQAILAPGYPHVLALVHVATVGWLTMTIMGASIQLVPVILVSPLRATRFAPAQYPLYITGATLLVTGFCSGAQCCSSPGEPSSWWPSHTMP